MKRLLTTLAAALAATLLAAPVWAQTITAPGLRGQPACVGAGETDNPLSGGVSNVSTNSVNLSVADFTNLYGALRSTVGDGGPTSFPLWFRIRDAKTNAQVNSTLLATVNSGTPNLQNGTRSRGGLTAKTTYIYTIESTASGFGESRPLLRRCFMTGGTYTPSNESGQPGYVANTTSGCFSISPRTYQDVQNCLCGRSRIWNDNDQNTAARMALGCAN